MKSRTLDPNRETKPIRIQRKRTKGWRTPPNTVYVGRPTKWGNPYIIGRTTPYHYKLTRQEAVDAYQCYITKPNSEFARKLKASISELRGKNLACWCRLDQPCHADVLLEIANS